MAAIFSPRRASPYHWGDGGRGWPLASVMPLRLRKRK